MIISRTPLRISFAGGGSDMKEFYREHGGAVVSVAIRKYVYLAMHPFFQDQKIFLKYSESELVDSVDDIRHKIIRQVFDLYGIMGVDFNSSADVPAGTGLGSSSSFTVGLVNLCNAYTNRIMHRARIAEYACEIEIDHLREPIGKQDQYAAAMGGMNYLRFQSDESVQVEPLNLGETRICALQKNLRMFYLGTTRSASELLAQQRKDISATPGTATRLKKMVGLADDLRTSLRSGRLDVLGDIMHTGWMYKRELTKGISNERIEHYYDLAMRSGATGGKLLGAGGSGFLLFYVPENHQQQLRNALELPEYPVEFDYDGTTIIYDDQIRRLAAVKAA